ncbi:retron Ec67 family RNA-directed DNA polymerase/endonuclease [Vibrio harveyi]|uniref:retron Ec67 family RNA-directed DNA polymerase/endonuclease n=1 Tax=Vibrio harveyi TaxID=669 RepID=UPI0036F25684
MNSIELLQNCVTRKDLARLLNCKPSHLSYVLYKISPASKYSQFSIDKKTGGKRTINAPTKDLKNIQKSLSQLLQNCIDDINKIHGYKNSCAHGFVRERSIITNAEVHKNQKNVANIDLESFFESFNFGRVRGFFIKNKHFSLFEEVATTIAQIACYNNALPQGSPCSPVITNLITHSLDMRLIALAKQNSCLYTRYADDLTFSTRKKSFPEEILKEADGIFVPSKILKNEIRRAGFSINHKKTRVQYKDSRQDVTGLVVNKKVNIAKDYYRLTKAMCNSLFSNGFYTKKVGEENIKGTIKELYGRLNFIDSVDEYNRKNYPEKLSIHYNHKNHGLRTRNLLNGREKTFSKFLFYKHFFANEKVSLLCEGKTDNIYLKCALDSLGNAYPKLVTPPVNGKEQVNHLEMFKYSKRTRFLMELYGGSTYLGGFIQSYTERLSSYKKPLLLKPVIILLDNDEGLTKQIKTEMKTAKSTIYINGQPVKSFDNNVKKADFIHITHNLYAVLTPLALDGSDTMIEDFFEQQVLDREVNNRKFDPKETKEPKSDFYNKNTFATQVVEADKANINFDGFKPIFDRLTLVIEHFESLK